MNPPTKKPRIFAFPSGRRPLASGTWQPPLPSSPPPPLPPLPSSPPPPPPPPPSSTPNGKRKGSAGRAGQSNCGCCSVGPCRHRESSTRQVHRHREVLAVLSASRLGFSLTNGRVTICVDGPTSNVNLSREVTNMGVTHLVCVTEYARERWRDVEKSMPDSFRHRFASTALIRADHHEACPYCRRGDCHRFNAVPLGTDRVFTDGPRLRPIAHGTNVVAGKSRMERKDLKKRRSEKLKKLTEKRDCM